MARGEVNPGLHGAWQTGCCGSAKQGCSPPLEMNSKSVRQWALLDRLALASGASIVRQSGTPKRRQAQMPFCPCPGLVPQQHSIGGTDSWEGSANAAGYLLELAQLSETEAFL
jgi:hypothetical protein